MNKKNLILIGICLLLIVVPFVINKEGEFEGADGQAEVVIEEIAGEVDPWATSLWEPPSGEVESFLFSLQAAIGAGFIGYFIGTKRNGKINKSVQ